MNSLFSKLAIATYRAVGKIAYPFMGPLLRLRASRGKEDRNRRYERYGYPSAEKPDGPIIWFHAASVGESIAVIPLIEHVNSLGINTIMTTGTVTSAQMIRTRLPEGCHHQYVPLDLKPALERFLNHWQPDLAIFTESEIWPMTILELANRRTPSVLVNGRMSDRSFKRWQGASGLAESLFENFAHIIAQSDIDAQRYRMLGARPVDVAGNLKVDTNTLPYDEAHLERFSQMIGNRPCWIAVSTHEGEEEAIGKIHRVLKSRNPGLLTMIAPRHPERAPGISAMLRENGMEIVNHSEKGKILPSTDIYMCDTIGEMGLFLNLAQVAFMGKSLKAEGGQNPLEPASTGTAIISGPNVHNFRDIYKQFLDSGSVRLVSNEKMLAANVEYLLKNPAQREKMTLAAMNTLVEMSGGLEKTITTLDTYLFPLTVKRNLEALG